MFRRGARRQGSPLLRTAIVGGAAYSMGKNAQHKAYRDAAQEQRLTELEQQQARSASPRQPQTASPAASSPERLNQLKTLGELRTSGVLTDAEFEHEKQKILQA